jgi:hypothetical protein
MTAEEQRARARAIVRRELKTGPLHAQAEERSGPEWARREEICRCTEWIRNWSTNSQDWNRG